ncbi:hypothetical protein [Puniceicoccus vermicola]|uniref:Uncharacterized protein n=1 Tax=Puniceicoccus vermicola TaxID=388746 RepID=A0A7X1E2U9_9BACT|nr:hypothetical protein [Puniceicoccus vermicola]MBC2600258.1 hypothetical protein [Puniceicoccus vermicola]
MSEIQSRSQLESGCPKLILPDVLGAALWDSVVEVEMKYRIVNESTIDDLLERHYNPPTYSKDFSEGDFSKEYWEVHAFIKDALLNIGTAPISGNYDDRDFSMNEDYIDSRGISIQVITRLIK